MAASRHQSSPPKPVTLAARVQNSNFAVIQTPPTYVLGGHDKSRKRRFNEINVVNKTASVDYAVLCCLAPESYRRQLGETAGPPRERKFNKCFVTLVNRAHSNSAGHVGLTPRRRLRTMSASPKPERLGAFSLRRDDVGPLDSENGGMLDRIEFLNDPRHCCLCCFHRLASMANCASAMENNT